MYTLKGVFPEPKKPHKKNFVRDNVKQVKSMQQGKAQNDQNVKLKFGRNSHASENLPSVKSSASNKSGKPTLQVAMTSSSSMRAKKNPEIRIKKGDMAEFLKRKELRQLKGPPVNPKVEDTSTSEAESTCRLKDVACQTIESNLSQQLADQRLTVPQEDYEAKQNASGDNRASHNRPMSPSSRMQNAKGDEENYENERKKKGRPVDPNKDPYLPASYQKGVLPRYLRERREEASAAPEPHDSECPPGHVTLPDNERRETLRMLRTSFAELVSELNKMPVRTDTLRMRARKMELEKQLAKLEEGIKVFSRPKVFVRIGE